MAFPSTVYEDINLNGGKVRSALTIAVASSTAATSAEAPAEYNIVSVGTTSVGGYRLPAAVSDSLKVTFVNNTGTIFTVYPPTGGTINGGSVDAGITVAAATGSMKAFIQTASITYQALQIA